MKEARNFAFDYEKLKALAKRNRFPISGLSRRIGKSEQYLNMVASKDCRMPRSCAKRIAELLHCTTEDFMAAPSEDRPHKAPFVLPKDASDEILDLVAELDDKVRTLTEDLAKCAKLVAEQESTITALCRKADSADASWADLDDRVASLERILGQRAVGEDAVKEYIMNKLFG